MLNMPYSVSGDHLFLALFTKIHLQFVSPLERGFYIICLAFYVCIGSVWIVSSQRKKDW
jgi:hypothetical protein